MAMTINENFNKYQGRAYPGQLSRPEQPFVLENNGIVAGEVLEAGQGVYFDTVTSKYLKPTDAPTALKVVGVVHSRLSDVYLNELNQYPLDASFELMKAGNIFVQVGVDVKRGDVAGAAFDGSGKWVIGSQDQAVVFVYENDAATDELVSIRTVGQNKAIPA